MVRIYHTSTLVKSFEIDLLRDVMLSVQCLGLPREPYRGHGVGSAFLFVPCACYGIYCPGLVTH